MTRTGSVMSVEAAVSPPQFSESYETKLKIATGSVRVELPAITSNLLWLLCLSGERRGEEAARDQRYERASLQRVSLNQLNHPARRMRLCSARSQGICCRTSAHALASHG